MKEKKFIIKKTQLGKEITINFRDDISLFRYRTISDRVIDAFINDELWLSSPLTFNDPYDFSVSYNKKEIKKFIEKITNENGVASSLTRILNNYVSNIFPNMVKELRSKYYVACFSELIKEEIMWSHYSSMGKGFALEYEMKAFYKEFTPQLTGVFPVYYTNHKPLIDVLIKCELKNFTYLTKKENEKFDQIALKYDLRKPISYNKNQQSIINEYSSLTKEERYELDQIALKILVFKKKSWQYEKEYRLITANKDNNQFFCYNNVLPKALYLGEFISSDDQTRLIKIAISKKIQVYKMRTDYTQGKNRLNYIKIY